MGKKTTKVRIIVPFYNAEKTLPRLVESLAVQTDQDFTALFLNDASKDNSYTALNEAIKQFGLDDKCFVVSNESNIGVMQNVMQGVSMTEDDTVVINCDGDDWLTPEAVSVIRDAYDRYDIDWAYANFMIYPSLKPGWNRELNKDITPRIFFPFFWCSHPRTWKASTFKAIPEWKFKDFHGQYYKYAADVAIQFSLFDVSKKFVYIPEYLYYYDVTSEGSTREPEKRQQQLIEEFQIRSQMDAPDMLVANAYFRHVVTFYESVMDLCEKDTKFKQMMKDRGFPID